MSSQGIFLTAEWRNLVLLNYEVDPGLLLPFVPRGTAVDQWNGKTFVSLVAFQFLNAKVFGVSIPLHVNFEEVNLRFYVKREAGGEVRRGVVFIREIVPRRAIAAIARFAYGENYAFRPMRHNLQSSKSKIEAHYEWQSGGSWGGLHAEAAGSPGLPAEGSVEQFITEHYWGYAAQRDGSCVEYQVKHPPWRVWNCTGASFDGQVTDLYGSALANILKGKQASAFIADGSPVEVLRGRRIA